jgi:pimeloyl-ACP methyl ester carboxylesterase
MTTFVLVHGASGGSYGWHDFANLLRKDGHEVYTPSLTGLGERSHLAGPLVNLSLHIKDVEQVFKYENLSDVVLVGHSYAGMVITGLADRIPELIRHLVYSDAFLPRDGESCFDLGAASGRQAAHIEDGWKIVFPNLVLPENPTPEQVRYHDLRSPQPVETFAEPVSVKTPLEDRAFTLTYVKAQAPPRDAGRAEGFWAAADRTSADPRWRYYETPTGHSIHREAPEQFRDILYEVVGANSTCYEGW